MTSPDWLVEEAPVEDEVHVIPLDDAVVHDFNGCICEPRVEVVLREGQCAAMLVTHHSLDGRELHEPDYRGEPDGPSPEDV